LRFNAPLPLDLSLIVLAEFPSHMSLSKSGKLKRNSFIIKKNLNVKYLFMPIFPFGKKIISEFQI